MNRPVATQPTFIAIWLPGASELGLEWIGLMETGFDVTTENQSAVVDELVRLRGWMVDRDEAHELEAWIDLSRSFVLCAWTMERVRSSGVTERA